MKKRGIFFTLLSLMFIGAFLLAFQIKPYDLNEAEVSIVTTQFQIANEYVTNLEEVYYDRALIVATYKGLQVVNNRMNLTNGFYSDYDEVNNELRQIVMYGNLTGDPSVEQFMRDSSFKHFVGVVENTTDYALRIKTQTMLDDPNFRFEIYQDNKTGPFAIGVNITINYSVDAGFAYWNNSVNILSEVPLRGLQDPLFVGYSYEHETANNGEYFGSIIKNTHEAFGNLTTFRYYMLNNSYSWNPAAPSYISRLYNDDEPSKCCGMERFVNLWNFHAGGGNTIIEDLDNSVDNLHSVSYLDYCILAEIYDGGRARCENGAYAILYNVSGLTTTDPSYITPQGGDDFMVYGFKIDAGSAAFYNLTDYLT